MEGRSEGEKVIEIHCRELAYVIIKSDKSQDLLSVSWRPRRTMYSSSLSLKT